MNSAWLDSPAAFVWCCVLAGMGIFFFVVSRRLPGRGYEYLGISISAVAVSGVLDPVAGTLGPTPTAFVGSRLGLLTGLFAVSFNLHFLYQYCGLADDKRILWGSYVVVSAAALANVMSTVTQFGNWDTLQFPLDYRSPSPAYTTFALALIAGHFAVGIAVLYKGYRAGQKLFPVFLTFVLLAPACLADVATTMIFAMKWYVAEAGIWIYCLVITATLLVEIQRAEGLLKETTSSLEARTAELEVSYKEIDMMYSELSQKQQLAAVGELAAAIAHEVRNPLAIIMNAVSGMKRSTITDRDRDTLLNIVNEESDRLNHLVAELLRFARPVAASKGPASLLDICRRAAKEPPDGYQVHVSTMDDNLDPVLVDPGLFRLALDNLMANSAQAMPDGGTIELSVRRGSFADGTPAAAVDIVDSGCGMIPEEVESAKKPFFTTKPRGTGLGIPIAVRIVEAHGGETEINSKRNQGTTVTLKVPYEDEVQRGSTYPGSKHPSTRRRLRSIPPGQGSLTERQRQAQTSTIQEAPVPPKTS